MSAFWPFLLWVSLWFVAGLVLTCLGSLFIQSEVSVVDATESFDCGIDPLGYCRVPFALHFFLIATVFVVFDAELLLALPYIFSPLSKLYWWFWFVFLGLLFSGLLLEFLMRTIDWKE